MYDVIFTPTAEKDFKNLDYDVQNRILKKVEYIASYPQLLDKPLKHLPEDLKGLNRYKVGDYRLLYWVYHNEKKIKIYGIEHRSKKYRKLR